MLDTLEEWLYSEEADDAGLDVLRSKRQQVGLSAESKRFVVIRNERIWPPCHVLVRGLISVGHSARSVTVVGVPNNRLLTFATLRYVGWFLLQNNFAPKICPLLSWPEVRPSMPPPVLFLMDALCLLIVGQVDKELKEGVAKGFFEAVEADKRKVSPPCVPCACKRLLHQ